MKKNILLLSLLLLVTTIVISISVVASSQAKHPAPEADETLSNLPTELPDHLVWNPDLGEYYNGDDFIWNSERQRYEPRTDNKLTSEVPENQLSKREWLEVNKNSNDPVIQALIEYMSIMDQYYKDNPLESFRSDNVIYDGAIQAIRDLGYGSLTEIYQYIASGKQYPFSLMVALEQMTGIPSSVVPSADAEGRALWMKNFGSNILKAADAEITSVADVEKYGVISVLHAGKMTSGGLSADKATTASITSAINEIKQEYDLSTEDIKAIAEFVQYIRTVHTAE